MIWFKEAIARCSFISWLVLLARLPTRDRLIRWGMNVPGLSVLCSNGLESHDHLFFSCLFSTEVWSRFTSSIWPSQLLDIQSITNSTLSIPQPFAAIAKVLFQVSVYLIWKERNARVFTSISSSPDSIIRAVDRMTRDRLLTVPTRRADLPSLLEVYFSVAIDLL